MTYMIGTIAFKNKTSAKKYVKAMLKRYSQEKETLHESIRLNDADNVFMQALLDKSPNVAEKTGPGIDYIYIADFHRVRWHDTFHVQRTDGTTVPLGYNKCFTGETPKRDVEEALRAAIKNQTDGYRNSALVNNPVCPYLKTPLALGNLHVDHASPHTFKALVDNFLELEGVQWFDLVLEESTDYHHCSLLRDKDLEKRWQQYHRDNAVLRLISVEANLSHAKKNIMSNPNTQV